MQEKQSRVQIASLAEFRGDRVANSIRNTVPPLDRYIIKISHLDIRGG